MRIGGAMFFTDYSMSPTELARALEERGFDSLWVPEHSHIPLTRKSPFPSGGDLPKKYYDVMDPFVVLGAAAAVTKTLLLGTGICLIAQRDPIQTAKQVASIDQVSGGRFLFGIGNGWNEDEMANHGTAFASRHKLARERIEAMKAIWTESKAEYHGEFVNFEPMMAWPKPVQKPHPPIIVGGAFPYGARRALRYGMAGCPTAHAPSTRTCKLCCRNSARWRSKRAAIPRRYRSRSGAPKRTSTCSSATATTASHAWSSASIPARPIRSCRNSTAGRR
jgi:probable F420-dependent oxidoreductase